MPRRLPQISDPVGPRITDMTELGRAVRQQRAVHGLRIDDAAGLCGVSADLLSRLENGRPVTFDKLLHVLDGLGLGLIVGPLQELGEAEAVMQTQASRRPQGGLRDA